MNESEGGYEIPEPIIDEIKKFWKGEGRLHNMNYRKVNGSWYPVDIGDLDRDDAGFEKDDFHVEDVSMSESHTQAPSFVQQACREVDATKLFEQVLNDPVNEDLAQAFSAAVNGAVTRAATAANFQGDLTLPLKKLRGNFVTYVTLGACTKHMIGAEADKVKRQGEEEKELWAQSWDHEVDSKGYPSEWKVLFRSIGDKQAVHRLDAQGKAVLPYSDQELRQIVHQDRYQEFDADRFNSVVEFCQKIAPYVAQAAVHLHGSREQPSAEPQVTTHHRPEAVDSQQLDQIPEFSGAGYTVEARPGYTIRNEKICGWRMWGSSHMIMVRINGQGRQPAIYELRRSTDEAVVDAYKATKGAYRFPSVSEVKKSDLDALNKTRAGEVSFVAIATSPGYYDDPERKYVFLIFRLKKDGILRAVWGSQFTKKVREGRDALYEAYEQGMGVEDEDTHSPGPEEYGIPTFNATKVHAAPTVNATGIFAGKKGPLNATSAPATLHARGKAIPPVSPGTKRPSGYPIAPTMLHGGTLPPASRLPDLDKMEADAQRILREVNILRNTMPST